MIYLKTTTNYGLKKPEGTDVVNIEELNYNADIIDQKIKEVDNKASSITVPVISVNSKTGDVTLTANDLGAETPSAAQVKANTAESSAKAYTDTKIAGVTTQLNAKVNNTDLDPVITEGAASTYTISVTNPNLKQYTIIPHVTNADNATVSVNGGTTLNLKGADGNNVKANAMPANIPVTIVRVGSNFFTSIGSSGIEEEQRLKLIAITNTAISGDYTAKQDIVNSCNTNLNTSLTVANTWADIVAEMGKYGYYRFKDVAVNSGNTLKPFINWDGSTSNRYSIVIRDIGFTPMLIIGRGSADSRGVIYDSRMPIKSRYSEMYNRLTNSGSIYTYQEGGNLVVSSTLVELPVGVMGDWHYCIMLGR